MDVKAVVEAQRAYYLSGATRPYAFRKAALEKLRQAVRRRESELTAALQADLHKHPTESYMCEIGLVLDELRCHEAHLRSWMRERRVPTPLAQFPARSFLAPEPYGVVLIATPWNYPLLLSLEPLIGAISGGNCAVVKPSAQTPHVSHALAELIGETFPPAYITVAECGRDTAGPLLEQRWDYIFFTGSAEVGRTVLEAAAKHLTPVTLELGGKSPVIVDRTADLRVAARRIAFGKSVNAGQTCVAPDYLLIEACVRDAFLTEYRRALGEFFPDGDYGDMAHIVSQRHYDRVAGLLRSGQIAAGGGTEAESRFVQPTLLIDVTPESPIMQQEIFGPILPVLTWTELGACIDFIRSRPKPLALYLFTADAAVKRRVLNTCSFGGGCINDTLIHLASSRLPFGGVGASGMGQYHGKKSFETFTHVRGVVDKGTWLDLPMRYAPYTEKKRRLIKRFLH